MSLCPCVRMNSLQYTECACSLFHYFLQWIFFDYFILLIKSLVKQQWMYGCKWIIFFFWFKTLIISAKYALTYNTSHIIDMHLIKYDMYHLQEYASEFIPYMDEVNINFVFNNQKLTFKSISWQQNVLLNVTINILPLLHISIVAI